MPDIRGAGLAKEPSVGGYLWAFIDISIEYNNNIFPDKENKSNAR